MRKSLIANMKRANNIFMNAYQNWKLKNNLDVAIVVYGPVGHGKSSYAFHTACALDPNFIQNIENQMIHSENQIPQLFQLLEERAKYIQNLKQNEVPKPLVILFDETQNLLYKRNAMTKGNKTFDQLFQNIRDLGVTFIFCFPKIYAVERIISERMDIMVIVDRHTNTANLFLKSLPINLDKRVPDMYNGRCSYLLSRLDQHREEISKTSGIINEIIRISNVKPDLIMNIPYYKDIYDVYLPFKRENNKNYIEKIQNNINKDNKQKTETKKRIEPKIKIIPSGGGEIIKDGLFNEVYRSNYYSYRALSQILGVSIRSVERKIQNATGNIKFRKDKNKKYFLLNDVLRLYDL